MGKHLTEEHDLYLKELEQLGYSYPQMKQAFLIKFERSISLSTICYRLDPEHRNRKRIYNIAKSTGIKMPKTLRVPDRSWDPDDDQRKEIRRQLAADTAKRGLPHFGASSRTMTAAINLDGPNWYDRKAGCQWIAGDPSHDDSCKCRKPLFRGPYCQAHDEIAHRKTPEEEAEENDGGIAWRATDLMAGYKKSRITA